MSGMVATTIAAAMPTITSVLASHLSPLVHFTPFALLLFCSVAGDIVGEIGVAGGV